jgi:hypothetical protein
LKNKNHDRIVFVRVFASGQTWDRVNTLLDRNGSAFQRRAQSSGSRVFRDFGDFSNPKTPKGTPKHTERSIGCRGQRDWVCRAVTPGEGLDFHRQACHRKAKLAIAALASLVVASGGALNSYVKGFILGIAGIS